MGKATTDRLRRSILYISHYYPPEVNAPALRVSRLAKHWAKQGHRVTVLTGFPNHPTGVIPPEYSGRITAAEKDDQVNVIRTYIYAAKNQGYFKRILNYLSFMFSAIVLGLPRLPDVDVVIATSPQFLVAVAGYVISLFKRAPFVFEVRDIWPEEIIAVGAIRNRLVIRLLEWIEMFLYRKASLIIAVAEGTIDTLIKRGVPKDKIVLLPNGIDLEEFSDSINVEKIRSRHSLDGEFLVSYIGTHGMAHKLDTVISAAENLKSNNRIKFMMIGDGAEKERLERSARDRGLDNMLFLPQMKHEEVVDYYKASDACLVPLRKASLFTRNIPSKIYEIMAAGKPILIGTEGESRKLVERAGAGIAFEPENSDSLTESIRKLYDDRTLADRLGQNGRNFASSHCRRDRIAEEYMDNLMRIME